MAVNQEVVEIKPEMGKLAEKAEEKKIPVFTVLKNNTILKNIFLVDSPPPAPSSSSSISLENKSLVTDRQELEEILVVGRHPDCNITLEHPSISRFHLRIHSLPSKQSLSVYDLSSVHGTWVCGKKISPGVRVELHDGDLLKLGGSSRVYRLHWIPFSHAYDFDNPFLPMVEESEIVEEKEETHQDNEGSSLQHDQSQMETDDFLFSDMDIISKGKQLTPSAPPMPEDMKSPFSYEAAENKHPVHHSENANLQPMWQWDVEGSTLQHDRSRTVCDDLDGLDLLFSDMIMISETTPLTSSAPLMHEDTRSAFSYEEEAENKNSHHLGEISGLQPVWHFNGGNSIPNAALTSGKSLHKSLESPRLRPPLSSGISIWKRRGKSTSVSVKTSKRGEKGNKTHVYEVKSQIRENPSIESVSEDSLVSADRVKEVFTPDKENRTPDSLLNRSYKKFGEEKIKHELIANSLMSCLYEDDEAAFTPDKENIMPNTHLLRSLNKMENFEEIKHPKSYKSSPLKNADSGIHQGMDLLGSSNLGNHVRKLLQEKKPARPAFRSEARLGAEATVLKGRADRVPFESLLASPNDTNPVTSEVKAAIRSCNSINSQQIKEAIHPSFHDIPKEENKKWTMVVDAACLLNKESRKALQLMQGLQGTSLIIPRIVIRELDCMKRRGNLFRRTAEVCSALQWIEDCMVNAQSWIHVQSSMEDVRPIASTPTASPLPRFSQTEEFSISSVPFSPCGSWLDIVSPTTEDHILECALFFRRIRNNGQLILLSNDVTLKIKSMAEGLLCETAEEFRQSLVNPFSERFLWTDSSPRGPTWSCVDDVVLREKYYNGPIQKQSLSGERAKGLKLILHHNSHFRQIGSVR